MLDQDQKTSLNRPVFNRGNLTLGNLQYARNDQERRAIDPNDVAGKLRELAGSLDFKGILTLLGEINDVKEKLVHTAAPAYPQDMLEGQSHGNNYEGLVESLGYKPEVDRPIGYTVPVTTSGSHPSAGLIYPSRRISGSDDQPVERWIAISGTEVLLSTTKDSRIYEYKSNDPEHRSAGVSVKPVEFESFDATMDAIRADLVGAGYDILETEPRLSSGLHPAGAVAVAATTE